MKHFFRTLLLLIVSLVSVQFAHADTSIGQAISRVPFTISKPGKYRLIKSLALSTGSTNAITITASDVVLDLNGFTLSGTNPALAHYSGVGLQAARITIRNGTVVGFGSAISLAGNSAQIEDMTCESQFGSSGAIDLYGTDCIVRRCRVTNPGVGVSAPWGIHVNYSALIEDCTVTDLHAGGNTPVYGFMLDAWQGSASYTAILRNCTASNLTSDSSSRYAFSVGVANAVVEHCTFYNAPDCLSFGGNSPHLTVKDCVFRSCGSALPNFDSSVLTDAGNNTFVP